MIMNGDEKIPRVTDDVFPIEIVVDIIAIPSWKDRDREVGEDGLREDSREDLTEGHSHLDSIASGLEIFDFWCKIPNPELVLPIRDIQIETLWKGSDIHPLIQGIIS